MLTPIIQELYAAMCEYIDIVNMVRVLDPVQVSIENDTVVIKGNNLDPIYDSDSFYYLLGEFCPSQAHRYEDKSEIHVHTWAQHRWFPPFKCKSL